MKTTWEVGADEYVHLPGIVLIPAMTTNRKFENWGKDKLVQIPVSNRYNGGFNFTDKNGKEQWARGFKVGNPVIPKGYELVSIHSGGNLMAKPNTVDVVFRKKGVDAKKI